MRRIFFSLLILLTAFRGIVGDAMAYEMAAGLQQKPSSAAHSKAINATDLVAPRADSITAKAQFDSNFHASVPCHESAKDVDAQSQADDSEHSCATCMVCHSPAMERPSVTAHLPKLAFSYILRQDNNWVSADLTHLQKPPVS